MSPEFRYLTIFGFWIAMWTFFPLGAFIMMLYIVPKTFLDIRKQRRQQAIANTMHQGDDRWLRMEGFNQDQADVESADWWKR